MPYVHCPECGLRSYTAAIVADDACPRCGSGIGASNEIGRGYDVLAHRKRPSLFIRRVPAQRRQQSQP